MTSEKTLRRGERAWQRELISLCLLASTVLFAILLSSECAEYVMEGMELAVRGVIPSSFPFMVISDLYVAYGRPEKIRLIKNAFTHLFGIGNAGIAPFICGNVGGFPIGAKLCADAYESGMLSINEAERLMPLSNNPSLAFVIGGVGIGIYGNIRIGILLYISILIATVICGMLIKPKTVNNYIFDNNFGQRYSFVNSVKKSGMSVISIISFITIFSVLLGIIKKRVKYAPLLLIFFSLSEVTNAVNAIASYNTFAPTLRIALCAFSLGFGGICVGLQSAAFATSAGIGMKKYYLIKLLEGSLASCIAALLYQI